MSGFPRSNGLSFGSRFGSSMFWGSSLFQPKASVNHKLAGLVLSEKSTWRHSKAPILRMSQATARQTSNCDCGTACGETTKQEHDDSFNSNDITTAITQTKNSKFSFTSGGATESRRLCLGSKVVRSSARSDLFTSPMFWQMTFVVSWLRKECRIPHLATSRAAEYRKVLLYCH